MKTSLGKRRTKISVQAPGYTDDGAGGNSATGSNEVLQIWAQVIPVKGEELFRYDQSQLRIIHKVICRYSDNIDTAYSLSWDIYTHRIISLRPLDQTKRYIEITTEQIGFT